MAALRRGGLVLRIADKLLNVLSYPTCLAVGIVLLAIAAIGFGINPPVDGVTASKFILMVVTLAVGDGLLAEFKQHINSETRRIASLQYVEFNKVLGLDLTWNYVRELTLATVAIVTSRGIQMMGGVIIVERLFGYSGVGSWCIEVLEGSHKADQILLITTALATIAILIREMGHLITARIDPRWRSQFNYKSGT